MIDWLKIRYEMRPELRLDGGRVIVFKPDGEIEWQKIKPVKVEGSHAGSLNVSVCAFTGRLLVDGNPTKYFQGHNAFGASDLRGLAEATFDHVCQRLEIPVPEWHRDMVRAGCFDILRVDVTEMYAAGNLLRARAVQAAIERLGHLRNSREGKGAMTEGTLYYRKHSRRWAAKIYCKGDEMRKAGRGVAATIEDRDQIMAWAEDKLRIEFVVRSMELKQREIARGHAWCDTTADELHAELLRNLEIPMNIELPSETLDALPGRLRLVYQAWKRGEDVRLLCSRASFYRYRAGLMRHGIDILVQQSSAEISNVVPFIHRIDLVRASVPEFARGTVAYFEPRRIA